MISLNEGHNMEAVCLNLQGWAQEIFLVDSYSKDDTVDIAIRHGITVVQRRFRDFGDQWNYALQHLPITSPWVMKLDPDERVTDRLKSQISEMIQSNKCDGISVVRRLWFMQKPLPVTQSLVRVWRHGHCRFTDVAVNEHPIVDGKILQVKGELEHHDSPDLDHWLEKQNRYTTAEAVIKYKGNQLALAPRLLGNSLERRMWLKKYFYMLPGKYFIFFWYLMIVQGAWRAGWIGWVWARLRTEVMRLIELKTFEMRANQKVSAPRVYGSGLPDPRVKQAD